MPAYSVDADLKPLPRHNWQRAVFLEGASPAGLVADELQLLGREDVRVEPFRPLGPAATPAGHLFGGAWVRPGRVTVLVFEPRVLAVPKGATVAFPNHDKVFHNVFSLSEASRFDLGLYRNGASRTASFETPGVVRVYCNIHPQMAAYVVVLDGSLYAQSGKDGVAAIAGVPAGRRALRVWEERGGEWNGTVSVPPGGTVEVTVSVMVVVAKNVTITWQVLVVPLGARTAPLQESALMTN